MEAQGTEAPGTEAPGTEAQGTEAPTEVPGTEAQGTEASGKEATGTKAPVTTVRLPQERERERHSHCPAPEGERHSHCPAPQGERHSHCPASEGECHSHCPAVGLPREGEGESVGLPRRTGHPPGQAEFLSATGYTPTTEIYRPLDSHRESGCLTGFSGPTASTGQLWYQEVSQGTLRQGLPAAGFAAATTRGVVPGLTCLRPECLQLRRQASLQSAVSSDLLGGSQRLVDQATYPLHACEPL
jgi:hypothetical protein